MTPQDMQELKDYMAEVLRTIHEGIGKIHRQLDAQ
jgi:hypothetical protein